MNRYAIGVEYRKDGLDRRLSTGVPDRSLTTIVEVLQGLATTTHENVDIVRVTSRAIEPEEALRFYRVQVYADVDDQPLPEPYEVIVVANDGGHAAELATGRISFFGDHRPMRDIGNAIQYARDRDDLPVADVPDDVIIQIEEPS